MAQIDALLDHMRNTGVVHATLRGEAPSQLKTASGVSYGDVVSGAMLEDAFLEIAPDAACQTMQESGVAAFEYNGFDFYVTVEEEQLQFAISPKVSSYVATVPTPYEEPLAPKNLPPNLEEPNDSGQGNTSTLPPELRGFNWGAFLLSWLWAIFHSSWIGLLCLLPCIGIFMQFYLGFKGNELAWRNRQFLSLNEFRSVQKNWAIAGLVLIALNILALPFTAAVLFPVFGNARANALRTSCQTNLRLISQGVREYAQTHGGQLPTSLNSEEFKRDLQRYVNSKAFDCPAEEAKGTSDYIYNTSIASKSLQNLPAPSRIAMIWDKPGLDHRGGRNIAFADGHIKWYREDVAQEWIDYSQQR